MKFDVKRKPLFLLLLFSLSFTLMVSFSGNSSSNPPEELCRNFVLKNLDKLIDGLEDSEEISRSTKKNKVNLLVDQYREQRKYYKEIEFFIEYYSSFDAKYYINGPLVPKHEIEFGPTIFEPQGFQVIEECLFDTSKTDFVELEKQNKLLYEKFKLLKEYYSTISIEKANLTEAVRLEIIRIMCLTLNGYDCTINKENTKEAAFAFQGVLKVLSFFSIPSKETEKCIKHLRENPDSDSFNRLDFITKFANPTYNATCNKLDKLNTGASQVNYAVNFRNHSVFDISSINKQHFSLYRDDTLLNKKQAELGQLLFFDPVLSGNNKRACASCHKPELAFTDGYDKSFAFDGKTKITRNAPTLLNAAYQKLYFYDGRIFNLEEQASEVFHNTFEMNSSADQIVKKLKQSQEYVQLFRNAFKGTMDTVVTFYAAMKSIAEYIKTLESKNSKFDKYIKGDTTQLNKSEINGYNLFAGKALCGSCHFYPLFNGLVPPMYNDNEFEVIGAPEKTDNKNLDPDTGRAKISHASIHNHAFKTPGIRNIALTAPYMHNGCYSNLDQVLEFYNKGGAGLNYKLENITLPFDSLGLNKKELNDIKLFLLSLTDTSGTKRIPSKLPHFNNEMLNTRKIGGEY